jgi:hypothetical protein
MEEGYRCSAKDRDGLSRRAEFETIDLFNYPFGQLSRFRYAAFAFLPYSARNLAHRAFVAFEILALAAADPQTTRDS